MSEQIVKYCQEIIENPSSYLIAIESRIWLAEEYINLQAQYDMTIKTLADQITKNEDKQTYINYLREILKKNGLTTEAK